MLVGRAEQLPTTLPGAEPQLYPGGEAVRLEGQSVLDVALGSKRCRQGGGLTRWAREARQTLTVGLQEAGLAQASGPTG